MKIVCIQLPDYIYADQFSNTPEGMLRVHTLLKMAGEESSFLDLRVCSGKEETESLLKEVLKNYRPEVCMVSAVSPQGNILNHVAQVITENSKSIVVVGGPHINALQKSEHWGASDIRAAHPHVHLFVGGYIWTLDDIRVLLRDVKSVLERSNLAYQAIIGRWVVVASNIVLPLMYEDLGEHAVCRGGGLVHKGAGDITQNMTFSVGCKYRCAFCFNYCRDVERGDPEDVALEIRRRIGKYGINALKINDDDPFADLDWNDWFIAAMKKHGVKISMLASTRCNYGVMQTGRRMEQFKELEALGLKVLGIGVEWPDDKVLKLVHKGTTVQYIKETVEDLVKNTGIKVLAYCIYGLPGTSEDLSSLQDFCEWAKGKISFLSMTNFVPLPGSPIYEMPHAYRMRVSMDMPYPNSAGSYDWEALYFVGDPFAPPLAWPDVWGTSVRRDSGLHIRWKHYKERAYQILDEFGLLRKETAEDVKKGK